MNGSVLFLGWIGSSICACLTLGIGLDDERSIVVMVLTALVWVFYSKASDAEEKLKKATRRERPQEKATDALRPSLPYPSRVRTRAGARTYVH